MFDISAAYGRGDAGPTGFRNNLPYELGEYYRGGRYVPLYDTSSPYGTQSTSQADVSMNALRGAGGYTHYSNMLAGTNGGKYPASGYSIGSFGSLNDNKFKCYGSTDPVVVTAYNVVGGFYLGVAPQAGSGIYAENNGWYSIQIINVDGAAFNYTLLRTNATSFTQGSVSSLISTWSWSSGMGYFVAGTTYNIRIRLTSSY